MTAIKPTFDLTTCDREPIHIPGSIQPHGVLLVVSEPEQKVLQASMNAADLLDCPENPVGLSLAAVLGETPAAGLWAALTGTEIGREPEYLGLVAGRQCRFNVLAHRFDGCLILDLDPVESAEPDGAVSFRTLHRDIRRFFTRIESAESVIEACAAAVEEIRRMTGFDRVLAYRFDSSWHGQVIAEDRDPAMTSYLEHWFPATDIPAQARELYRLNRIRLIPDVSYQPVPIQPAGERPLNLTFSILRSVSPTHLEYLRNMQVQASMSISILREGQLWGLLACHHRKPLLVPFETRMSCELLSQYLSEQIDIKERAADLEQRINLKSLQTELLASIAPHADFMEGLAGSGEPLRRYADAAGSAILYQGKCILHGETPPESEVRRLAAWLVSEGRRDVFCTDCLSREMPGSDDLSQQASGVLAISISKLFGSYIIWFRPEVIRTVRWAGDPNKPVEDAPENLHPRRSFEAWKQIVRGCSKPWTAAAVDSARELRIAIIGIVLRKAEELGALSAELQRSNRELESFSYSVSHDLRAPFRHIVGYAELLKESGSATLAPEDRRYLDVIIESAYFAGDLVENLLNYSRIGRMKLTYNDTDMEALVREVVREAAPETGGRVIEWSIGSLPQVRGDTMLMRVVWQNLIGNALKYTRTKPVAKIDIGAESRDGETVFHVVDNGVGFDPQYASKLFGVFQRLHKTEEFEGTGIGLANVRRIVQRHEGTTWAEGRPGEGAAFFFSIPKSIPPEEP